MGYKNLEQKNIDSTEEEKPKKVIVEIGPGAIPLRTGKNEHYIAIDAQRHRLESTGINSDVLNKGGADLVTAFAEKLPLNNSADEIIMRNVLGHTFGGPEEGAKKMEIKELCSEIKTALKKDGKFVIVETYTPPPLDEVKEILAKEGLEVKEEVSGKKYCRYLPEEDPTDREAEIIKRYGKNMWENMRDWNSYILVFEKKEEEDGQ